VYPLATHYRQTWQYLPDYGANHATLIADPALPGKWKADEEVAFLLAFENSTVSEEASDGQAKFMLVPRLSDWWKPLANQACAAPAAGMT
jgi:hypothetical protein